LFKINDESGSVRDPVVTMGTNPLRRGNPKVAPLEVSLDGNPVPKVPPQTPATVAVTACG
jgi:hypothetical protein